ncbi:Fic family protein [uncultured Treponema sp.]|uniref:Fic family protein n=1 Tax=uncultured Treponema sp. TaxID=162155 RepID=UPI0025CFBA18|nr:Fic family protein [uncultured Treponema sp.]
MSYEPPFKITDEIINLVVQIAEKIGELKSFEKSPLHVELRKENRIKTIHSSLAIENNSLSIEQITAIIEGKRVLGSPNEIQEVKNAVQAYDLLLELNPYEEKDLLRAHQLMMAELVEHSGKYRNGGVGIFDGKEVVHLAPPADRVPFLMADLFEWLRKSSVHPLIKSCVFHYEFEFIHPFEDGNGRMGRLWQTVILKEWKSIFAWIPVESLVKENQAEYYNALNSSDTAADSTKFIEFMLNLILRTVEEIISTENAAKKITAKITIKITANQRKILDEIEKNPFVTQEELSAKLGIARLNIIKNMKKLQENNIICRVGATKNGHWEIVEAID